jgi:hypothetical protein
MAATFTLSVHSMTPPELPPQPTDLPATAFKSSLISGSPVAATSPLLFTLRLPNARPKNPLLPASHLQVVFSYHGTGDIFLPRFITPGDLVHVPGEGDLYEAQVAGDDVPRVKVNIGETSDATVSVYAWKGEKLLGRFEIGKIEGLGLIGLKSEAIHKRRVEEWMKDRTDELV